MRSTQEEFRSMFHGCGQIPTRARVQVDDPTCLVVPAMLPFSYFIFDSFGEARVIGTVQSHSEF